MGKNLLLAINKPPFDVMVTGEKTLEIRKPTDWILCRLFDKKGKRKQIDLLKFVNGYGDERPYFICEFQGFAVARTNYVLSYSSGFSVEVEKFDLLIKLGKIIEKGNLK